MNTEKIVELFGEARELEGEARTTWLEELARRDPESAARLRKLLRADERAGSLLERRPEELLEPPHAEESPQWIGPYRILREIGRGEDVHRAERDEVARAMTWLRRRETGQ